MGSATSSSLTVSWSAVSGATFYELQRATSSAGPWTGLGQRTSPTTDTGLSSGTTYWYQVRACNAADCSGWSAAGSGATSLAPPATPSAPTVGSATSSSLTVSWSAVSGATFYELQRATNSAGPWTGLGQRTSPTTDTGLSSSTTYWYQVRACNTVVCSGWSMAESGATSVSPPVTVTVTILIAGTGNGAVTHPPSGLGCTKFGGSQSGVCNVVVALSGGSQFVTLSASPFAGSVFVGWSGVPCIGIGSTCQFELKASVVITATFASSTQPPPSSAALAAVSTTSTEMITSQHAPSDESLTGRSTSSNARQTAQGLVDGLRGLNGRASSRNAASTTPTADRNSVDRRDPRSQNVDVVASSTVVHPPVSILVHSDAVRRELVVCESSLPPLR